MHYYCLYDIGNNKFVFNENAPRGKQRGIKHKKSKRRMMSKENIEIELQERIKELNCWYGMARLAENHHNSLEDFLKSLVAFLPQSWRYAEVACARIIFRKQIFAANNFAWAPWQQSAPIQIGGEPVGEVSIVYKEERPAADEGPFLKEERALLEGVAQRIGEIAIRVMAEQELQENNKKLLLERKALQDANAALRAVLANIEDEKKQIYENMQLNIENVIMPLLHALASVMTTDKQHYIDLLKTNLEEITSPYISRIVNHYHSLTPVEINICSMIRNGLRTKEIARLRGVSAATINRHREHIRRKLNIANQRINLTAYLQSLAAPK